MTKHSTIGRSVAAPAMGDGAPSSLNETYPSALSFSGPQDAINFARNGIEHANRRAAGNAVKVVERYVEGKISIVLKVAVRPHLCDYDVVLVAIKSAQSQFDVSACDPSPNCHTGACDADGHQESVLVGIAELVESPEGIIPSLMRVERAKKRTDFRREVFAPAFRTRIKVNDSIPEGEVCVSRFRNPGADSDGISTLVQGGTKSLDGFNPGFSPTIRDLAIKLQDMKPGTIRVCLDGMSSWFVFEESCDTFFKPTSMLLCARKPALGAVQ